MGKYHPPIYSFFTVIFHFLLHFQFPPTLAKIELFEAWNRKNYKEKDVRYAMFDPDGIITFDGNVNGKSGDLQFPNGHREMWDQSTCDKNPELMFQMCETDEHKAWTGVAICYESQLAQTDINPFFRIQNDPKWEKLVFLICGERQSALFINRTVVLSEGDEKPKMPKGRKDAKNETERMLEQGGGKYKPFYTIWTSFAPNKTIHFKMPGKPAEKRCALLRIGGENILGVSLTNLRREPLELYKDDFVFKNDTKAIYNTSDPKDFMQEFPDMANRKNRLSDIQSFELLLLDFMPPFEKLQNVSIYGWLPMKIKITSKAISPCRVDWRLLESREIQGRKGSLVISYTIVTGSTSSTGSQTGGSKSNTQTQSKTDSTTSSWGAGNMLYQYSAEHSYSDTYGSQQTQNSDFSVNTELMQQKSTTREETVQFDDFEGQVNVEQMLYTCHGVTLFPDKIRYHDSNGRKIDPVPEDTSDPKPILLPRMPDVCEDSLDTCPIWAAQDQCRKSAATMLIQCRKSCNLCAKVKVEKKAKPTPDDLPEDDDDDDDDDCEDDRKYCPAWKRMDECQKNPAYMSRFCRKSCGLCVDVDDIDDAEVELAVNRQKY